MLWNRILLLYDNTENALRAVEYVGKMFGSTKDVSVTLMGLFDPIPSAERLEGDAPGMDKLRASFHSMEVLREKGKQQLHQAVNYLAKAGIKAERIDLKHHESRGGMAKEIISVVEKGGYGTVVVGQTTSKGLFDFLSSDLARSLIKGLKGCTICVVS